jgi:hypothetical protein
LSVCEIHDFTGKSALIFATAAAVYSRNQSSARAPGGRGSAETELRIPPKVSREFVQMVWAFCADTILNYVSDGDPHNSPESSGIAKRQLRPHYHGASGITILPFIIETPCI